MENKADEISKDDLLQMPMHKLRTMAKELGINIKPRDKKTEIVDMLFCGKEKDRKKPAPKVLNNKSDLPKPKADVPPSVLKACRDAGVTYKVDEQSCSITFFGQIPTTCTLDQSEKNILTALKQSAQTGRQPIERNDVKGSFI